MASDTDTAKPDPKTEARRRRPPRAPSLFSWLPGSRLGRLIILLNVLGLAIIIAGSLLLNELRRGLVGARIDSLTTQGELIVNVINRAATVGEPTPELDSQAASEILQMLSNPRSQRARLFDAKGNLIAARGTRVNPLDMVQLSQALVFIDGDNAAELQWALRTWSDTAAKIIFVSGSPFDAMKPWQRRFYFDQGGTLTSKFGIRHTPAVVSAAGSSLKISEVPLPREAATVGGKRS